MSAFLKAQIYSIKLFKSLSTLQTKINLRKYVAQELLCKNGVHHEINLHSMLMETSDLQLT